MEITTIAHDKESKNQPKHRSFAADVLTLVGGTAVAQVIGILVYPIITRLYGADAFGLAAVFSSLVGIITVVACLRYELAIMLPKTNEGAANLLASCLLITSVISLTLAPILWLFGTDISALLNAPGLLSYLWLVPLMVFLSGSYLSISYWNSRKRQFGRLSATQVTNSIATSGTQLGVGFAGYPSGGGLIGAKVIGQAIATLTLSYQTWKSDKQQFKQNITGRGMASELKRYINFPKVDTWSALINSLSLQMPIFILTAFFSSTIVGYYSIGLSVLQLPMNFIGSAIAQVFFQRISEASNQNVGEASKVVESILEKLVVIGLFPILLIAVVGEELFTVILGAAWSEAGLYAQILAFPILIRFIFSPISTLFTVQRKLRAFLVVNITLIFAYTGSLVWGGLNNNIYFGLIISSISVGSTYIIATRWILSESNASFKRAMFPIKNNIFLATLLATTLLSAKVGLAPSAIIMAVSGIICAAMYYSYLAITDGDMRNQLKKILQMGRVT